MDSIRRSPEARPEVEVYIVPDGTCFLFDPVRDEGFALDQLGALVWDYCDGQSTQDDIAREVSALLPLDLEVGERVKDLLATFAAQGLLLPDTAPLAPSALAPPPEGAT